MKLETILNAYGNARAKHANATGIELFIAWKYHRQAEKFKMRLLETLRIFDECNDNNMAIVYEEDLLHYCLSCSGEMQIIRPGKWQCPNCE